MYRNDFLAARRDVQAFGSASEMDCIGYRRKAAKMSQRHGPPAFG